VINFNKFLNKKLIHDITTLQYFIIILVLIFKNPKKIFRKLEIPYFFCIPQYFDMKNLIRMIILNFGRVTIKFEPYALRLEMQTFSQ
jgi:hypothetical protein